MDIDSKQGGEHVMMSEAQRRSVFVTNAVIYINIVLYATCFQLQRPLEPFMIQNLQSGATDSDAVALEYAKLQSFFSMIQMFGSLIVGGMIDKVGVRYVVFLLHILKLYSFIFISLSNPSLSLFLPCLYPINRLYAGVDS